jgi:diguanylate cyclase (GGDEF)-like protein
VLKIVALRFRAAAKSEDTVARLGGDEFAVIAPSVSSRRQARSIALRFIQVLAEGIEIGGRCHFVGVAVGVAAAPNDGSNAAELVRRADKAMYDAKGSGYSAVSFFGELKLHRSA